MDIIKQAETWLEDFDKGVASVSDESVIIRGLAEVLKTQAGNWQQVIDVNGELPEDKVLLSRNGKIWIGFVSRGFTSYESGEIRFNDLSDTYFMPLPPPPSNPIAKTGE